MKQIQKLQDIYPSLPFSQFVEIKIFDQGKLSIAKT